MEQKSELKALLKRLIELFNIMVIVVIKRRANQCARLYDKAMARCSIYVSLSTKIFLKKNDCYLMFRQS